MSLDPATVRRIAQLARIRIEEAEVPRLQAELNGILGWIEQLNEVDVDGVEPMAGAARMALKMREDVVTDGGYRREGAGQRARADRRLLRRAEGGRVMLTDLTIAAARDGAARRREFTARELTEAHLGRDRGAEPAAERLSSPSPPSGRWRRPTRPTRRWRAARRGR